MKFVNHKYNMTSDLQKRLFTSILQNSYLINVTSYKNATESFFKIKTFKTLKEVMKPFLNVKNFKSPKKVMESFFVIKNFKAVMVSLFSIKNFKSRKAVVVFSLSFKSFKSRWGKGGGGDRKSSFSVVTLH